MVRRCLALIVFTCGSLLAQTDASGSSSGGQANSPSGEPSQSAPGPGTPQSTQANANGDSTRLVIVKLQKPEYPLAAMSQQIQGQVWIHLVITETGDVESAEAISGNPLLAEATVKAMKQWKFKPYVRDGHPVRVSTKLSYNFAFRDKVKDATESSDPGAGKVLPNSSAPPAAAPSSTASDATVSPPSNNPQQPVVVAQVVSQGLLIHRVQPVYPESARKKRIQGTVVLQGLIGKDGLMKTLRVVGGPPELVEAAIGAVQQWSYKPYLLNGEPVEVDTTINVNFALTPR